MVASKMLLVYMKKSKILGSWKLFQSWEKYGMFERSFISIENIGSYGIIIFTPITYGRIRDALGVYEKNKKYLYHVQSFQTLRKVWDIWTFFHFYWKHWIPWEWFFTLCTYGRATWKVNPFGIALGALTVYGKTKKIYAMYNLFKPVENYGMFERSFISIENTILRGNYYFTLCTYSRIEDALTVYEKIKNICTMYNLFKRWEKYRIFNVLSFL